MTSAAAASPTTGPSVSGKSTMLLSNEARREVAKQARAVKEERRAALDARHKYLMSRLADAGSLEEAAVEDAIVSDDRFSLIHEFFAANGSKKLIFFYQDVKQSPSSRQSSFVDASNSAVAQRKLFLTTGNSEPLLGKCLFFLRTTEKAITTANVQQEVNFGVLDCSGAGGVLNSLETLLTHIMLPALRSQQSWGSVQDGASCPHVRSFLSSVDQFVSNLSSARLNMERKFQLQHVELPDAISQLSSPADYRAAANNSELVERLEEALTLWTNQIKQVLTESEQMRKEADDAGPSAELEHWKSCTVTFNSLLEEVKGSQVRRTLGVLQVAQSRCLRAWRDLDRDITVVANEAKDNVKYLSTLNKFFGSVEKSTPTRMLEHIPSLMNGIKMIHVVSQYYNTSERTSSLLLKVTNQMISTCRSYLLQGVRRVWEHSRV
ncbi:dynein heavy chain 5, axonemal-like [Astatotilapia calliptera]|uniref:dynein heavy chain 5, axonemal-like n=1 Tax=Astatotilapia calliptera TaxID=8154 RepID=UPI000E3FFFC6|nr:dynein heavy chain 5, axonemal-like [Astatotilapia calliptera]